MSIYNSTSKDNNQSLLLQKEKKEKRKYLSCELQQHEEQRVHARYIHTNSVGNVQFPQRFICQQCYDKNPDYYSQYTILIEDLLNIDKNEFAINNWPQDQILKEPIDFIREKERETEQIHQVEKLFDQLKQSILVELEEAKTNIIDILKEEHSITHEILQELKNQLRSTFQLHTLKQKIEEVNRTKSRHYHHHNKDRTMKNTSKSNISQNQIQINNPGSSPLKQLQTIQENENQHQQEQNLQNDKKKHNYYGNKQYELHDKLKEEIQELVSKSRLNKTMEIVEYYHKNLIKTKQHKILKKNFEEKSQEIVNNIKWIKNSTLPQIPRITFQATQHNDSQKRVFVEGNVVRIKSQSKGTIIMTDTFHKYDKLTFSFKINKIASQNSCWYIGVVADQDISTNYCWFPSGNQICLHCNDIKHINSKHKFQIEGQPLKDVFYEGIQIFCEVLIDQNIFKFKVLKQNNKEFNEQFLKNPKQQQPEQKFNTLKQKSNISNFVDNDPHHLLNQNDQPNSLKKTQTMIKQDRELYDKVDFISQYQNQYDFSQDFQYKEELNQWRLIFQSSYDLSFETIKLEKIPTTFEHL